MRSGGRPRGEMHGPASGHGLRRSTLSHSQLARGSTAYKISNSQSSVRFGPARRQGVVPLAWRTRFLRCRATCVNSTTSQSMNKQSKQIVLNAAVVSVRDEWPQAARKKAHLALGGVTLHTLEAGHEFLCYAERACCRSECSMYLPAVCQRGTDMCAHGNSVSCGAKRRHGVCTAGVHVSCATCT